MPSHDVYFDVQKVILPADQNSISVSIFVTPQNGDGVSHQLTIYRQTEATTVESIEVTTDDGTTYTAYATDNDKQNYQVIIPADNEKVDIKTTPHVDVATVTYTPSSRFNSPLTAPTSGEFTYEDYVLDGSKSSEEVQITLTADSFTGAPYTLTIIKMNEDEDPFVSVDGERAEQLVMKVNGVDEPIYVYAVDDNASTAEVTLTTSRPNASVSINGSEAVPYTTTETVNISMNENGYMDVPLNVQPSGTAAIPYTLRLYKESADPRLGDLTVKGPDALNNLLGDDYEVEYDVSQARYIARVKNSATSVRVMAQSAQSGAHVGISAGASATPDAALAKSDAFAASDTAQEDVELIGAVTTIYIAVTPAASAYKDNHTAYRLDIVKMSADTDIELYFGDDKIIEMESNDVYRYTLPASTDDSDNTTNKLKAVGKDSKTKVTVSDQSVTVMPEGASNTAEKEFTIQYPGPTLAYVLVTAEDGTSREITVKLYKLPETSGIKKVNLTEVKTPTTFNAQINTYSGPAPYSDSGIVVYVETVDARS